jgi:hypothetical protein
MIKNTTQIGPPDLRGRNAVKPTPVAMSSVTMPKASKPQRAEPSHAAIAEKAYELWLGLGQVLGRDQEHWFEAERQLRRV